jgi:hypothetical protein
MNLSRHCDLCENERRSLKNGLTCDLTNKKPEFQKTCSTINLSEKFQEKLEKINIELETLRKNSVHFKFYTQIIIGFIFIFTSLSFLKNYTGLLVYYGSYTMISIGITFWGIAFSVLNKYRRKIKNAEFDKNEIDEFLQKYGIKYSVNIIFLEKIHGIQELVVELEYINWTKKRTTTPYKKNCYI